MATDSDADLNPSTKKKPHQSYVGDSDDDDDASSEPESDNDEDDGEMDFSDEDFGGMGLPDDEYDEEAEGDVEESQHDLPGI